MQEGHKRQRNINKWGENVTKVIPQWNRFSWKLCEGIWMTGRQLQPASMASKRTNHA